MFFKRVFVIVFGLGLHICSIRSDISSIRPIVRNLVPPHYLYDHFNHQYVPPLETVDHYVPPLETVDIPVPTTPLTTKATTQRPPTTTSTTTEFFLPEIIVNRDVGLDSSAMVAKLTDEYFNGYPHTLRPVYLPAATPASSSQSPPKEFDDEEHPNHYLPPTPTNVYIPANDDAQQPQHEEEVIETSYQYISPTSSRTLNKFPKKLSLTTFNLPSLSPLRLELSQLRCLSSPEGGYFQALLNIQQNSVELPPILLSDGSPSAESCGIRMVRSKIIVNIRANAFQRCGVESCGGETNELCLRLSFPQISGMTTAADGLLTLQCKAQEKVNSQTHSLHVGVSKDSLARSAGTFAQGGSQQPFRTLISLFRAGKGLLSSPLAPGTTVQLGEELVLRAHVKAGDGWNNTRISDVFLQRLSPNGDILNSANLITSAGCVQPLMRSVCPAQPIFEPPLGHRLTFRAVMFQGMRSGDEMVLSVKVVGCIHSSDCFVDNRKCDRLPALRNRRQTEEIPPSVSEDLSSDVALVSFRVDIPDTERHSRYSGEQPAPVNAIGIIGVVATLTLIVLAMLIGLYIRKRRTALIY